MAQKKISDLTALASATGADLLLVTHDNNGTLESNKMSLSTVATFIGGKALTGTLSAGSTSLVLQDAVITTSSTIDIYTDVYGVNPTAVTVATGSITLTFEARQSALNVKVYVR